MQRLRHQRTTTEQETCNAKRLLHSKIAENDEWVLGGDHCEEPKVIASEQSECVPCKMSGFPKHHVVR